MLLRLSEHFGLTFYRKFGKVTISMIHSPGIYQCKTDRSPCPVRTFILLKKRQITSIIKSVLRCDECYARKEQIRLWQTGPERGIVAILIRSLGKTPT